VKIQPLAPTLFCAFLGVVAIAPGVHAQAAPLSAQAKSDFKKYVDDAVAAYKAKDYKKAIEGFEKAHAIDPKVNLVFNIAKCHEALGENTEAIAKYTEFADTPGADAPSRAKALETAKALQEIEDAKKPKPPEPKKNENNNGGGNNVNPPPPPRAEPPARSPLPWIMFGTGAAFGVAGGVFALLASGARSDVRSNCKDAPAGYLCNAAAETPISRDGTFSLLADIGFGVGIVAVGIGVVSLVTRAPAASEAKSSEPRRASNVRVFASPSPRGATLGIGGAF
jgi:tetratricopeptide (TPR) repeat protein